LGGVGFFFFFPVQGRVGDEETHLGEGQRDTPDLTLVTETVLSGELGCFEVEGTRKRERERGRGRERKGDAVTPVVSISSSEGRLLVYPGAGAGSSLLYSHTVRAQRNSLHFHYSPHSLLASS
jgi:hypothetical protein